MDEIIENLFLGELAEAQSFDGAVISVMNRRVLEEPDRALLIPILREEKDEFIPSQLDLVSDLIERELNRGRVFCHCAAGFERSPMAAAWFLHKKRGMGFFEAYNMVKQKHPQTIFRVEWLPDEVKRTLFGIGMVEK